ncbi:MAG TPA: hypothetical protein VER17_16065 [Tepidisphaeraceae bacterium]|nr:hypothetical protein [Tepidisphaeraceae bacterium]
MLDRLVGPLPAIFALVVGAFGWYYLFYSRSARNLEGLESEPNNRLRGILRRVNAVVMLLIAVGIAVLFYRFQRPGAEREFVFTSLGVMMLLLVLVALGLIDVRLTWKLRRDLKERNRR